MVPLSFLELPMAKDWVNWKYAHRKKCFTILTAQKGRHGSELMVFEALTNKATELFSLNINIESDKLYIYIFVHDKAFLYKRVIKYH